MTIHQFRKIIDNIADSLPDYADNKITVLLSQPSIGASASTEVIGVSQGFDWDAGQIMLRTRDRVIKKGGNTEVNERPKTDAEFLTDCISRYNDIPLDSSGKKDWTQAIPLYFDIQQRVGIRKLNKFVALLDVYTREE